MPPQRPTRPRRQNILRFCPCCKKGVPNHVYSDHMDRVNRKLEAEVAGDAMMLDPLLSGNSEAGSASTSAPPVKSGGVAVPRPAPLRPTTTNSKESSTTSVKDETQAFAIFKELRTIEDEIDRRHAASKVALEGLSSLSGSLKADRRAVSSLRKELLSQIKADCGWMKEQRSRIQEYTPRLDLGNSAQANAMLEQLQAHISTLEEKIPAGDASTWDGPVYDTSRYFSEAILTLAPSTLIILMMAVILNLVANLTRGPCNFVLRMCRLAVQVATNSSLPPDIPEDIRTARRRFNLDPVVVVYAVCTSCGKLHKPTSSESISFPIYPPTCDCGSRLTKATGHHNGVAIRKPIQPYAMQCFKDHRARMLARPGYEVVMDRHRRLCQQSPGDHIHDIGEARAYRDLKGPDGRPFHDCSTEIRSVWSLSYDGYNPGSNKAAGKAASVGSLAMACLSLPPCLRNLPENLYLVGLVPGPKQPAGAGLNPFIAPLVDQLHDAFYNGTYFSETYEHPEGIVSRDALLPIVNDLPAARKVVGGASHSASSFCMYCHVLRADINNIDMSTEAWKAKTSSEFRKAAEAWRDAPPTKKKGLYKRNGVRWSELLRLDYWDPVQNTVLDGMHKIFLGNVGHHFREVIGTHWTEQSADPAPERAAKEKDLQRGRALLDNGEATLSQLEKLPWAALRQICLERSANPVALPGKKLHRRQFAVALLADQGLLKEPGEAGPSRAHRLEETDIPDLFAIDLGEGSSTTARRELLDTEDLKAIQADIKATLRPSNQPSPPSKFGSPSHGKLKADEWRACIEFDLPVSLVKLWADSPDSTRVLALKSTFWLAIAVRYAVSRRTSASHREKYMTYMQLYLRSLLELHPNDSLRPNHHNALHLPKFLELFGPIHGWWMFPFERLIGILQRHKTNFKFGELEETVMKAFCASAHLKNILDQPSSSLNSSGPTIFEQALDIIRQCLPDAAKGSMLQSLGAKDEGGTSTTVTEVLDSEIADVFTDANLRGVPVNVFRRIKRDGHVFADKNTSRSHSTVFFKLSPHMQLFPAVIRKIFDYRGTPYLVVHRYQQRFESFFDQFSEFGAEVWSQEVQDHPLILPLSPTVYPALLRKWEGDRLVLKPIMLDF